MDAVKSFGIQRNSDEDLSSDEDLRKYTVDAVESFGIQRNSVLYMLLYTMC